MLTAAALLAATSCAAASKPATARLGGLFPMFHSDSTSPDAFGIPCFAAFRLALREINNKTDGVADELLPDTRLEFAYRDSKCNDFFGFYGAVELHRDVFDGQGVHAMIGTACSVSSLPVAFVTARAQIPTISYSATSGELSDGASYPFFARTPPSDAFQALHRRHIRLICL